MANIERNRKLMVEHRQKIKESFNESELNEATDVIIKIAEILDVGLEAAKMILALSGVTGMVTLTVAIEKIQKALSNKHPKMAKKLAAVASGAASGRR
jgi:hypothetical protein